MQQQVVVLKAMARKANELGDWDLLRMIIAELDSVWTDHRAAMAFYTELEQGAEDPRPGGYVDGNDWKADYEQ